MGEGNRGDVGTRKDLKFGSGMMKRMAVKGRVGQRVVKAATVHF